jgi:hypothetical protein
MARLPGRPADSIGRMRTACARRVSPKGKFQAARAMLLGRAPPAARLGPSVPYTKGVTPGMFARA